MWAGHIPIVSPGLECYNYTHSLLCTRERTKKVYTMYSRKPNEEVWQHHRDLQVDYTILEQSWCVRRSQPGCGMAEVWDLEDVENRQYTPTCSRLHKEPRPYFQKVFGNNVYEVLKVLKEPLKNGNGDDNGKHRSGKAGKSS